MRGLLGFAVICLATLTFAQSPSATPQPSQASSQASPAPSQASSQAPPTTASPSVSTQISTSTVFFTSNGQRQSSITTFTSLLTIAPPSPQGSSNGTANGAANTTTTTTTSTSLRPANPTADGGGNPAGAPSPGGSGGFYGPDDSFIAAALMVKVNAALVTVACVAAVFVMRA